MFASSLLTLAGAVVGAILGWLLTEPHRLPSWLFLRAKSHLNGEWLWAWQCNPEDPEEWIYDRVRVKNRLGKLYAEVIESSGGFNWRTSLLNRGGYFLGVWHSRRPDASACGTLTLKASKQGNRFVGYWLGPTESNLMSGRVIVGRDQAEIEYIKARFKEYL